MAYANSRVGDDEITFGSSLSGSTITLTTPITINDATGQVKISASVLSHSGHPTLAHLWKNGQEGPPLKSSSPYWLEIRRLDAKGQPVSSLPPQGGCFEVTLPQKLLNQAATFELHWIDFYR